MAVSRIFIDGFDRRRMTPLAGLLLWLLVQATGCGGASGSGASSAAPQSDPNAGVPEWVMTAKAQTVDLQMSLGTAQERAISALRSADLPERHLPAEQLATAALQNLRAGHAADAAVWLSLGSYRYRQEWSRILHAPDVGGASPGSLPAAFYQLRSREQDVYGRMNFDAQLSALGQVLRGEELPSWDLRARLVEMFRDESEDAETLAEAVRRKLRARGELPQDLVTATDLSKSYWQHLRAGAQSQRDRVWAVGALSDTPLAPYALEALRWGYDGISPGFCSRIAGQLSTRTTDVIAFLADSKPVARENAAVVLGMNPDAAHVPELERRLATEEDASVKLTLAYALARNGQRARIQDLVKALGSCPAGVCEDAMSLLSWLPSDLVLDLDPEIFVRLATDVRQRLAVRLSAIGTLGKMGRKKALSARTRLALLGASQEKNAELSYAASQALKKDIGFSRELVLAALAKPTPAYAPLFERLARVATVEDLPVLRQHMPRFAARPGAETDALTEAVARLSGGDAEALLLTWFDAHPLLRRSIAFRLIARSELEPSTEAHLAAAKDRDVRLLVRVIRRLPDGLSLLQHELRSAETPDRQFAAFLAGLVREPRVEQELWSLVNFRDDRFYPDDARIRHAAMSSLLWIALDELVATRASK